MNILTPNQLIEFTDKLVAGFLFLRGAPDANSVSLGINGCGFGDNLISKTLSWGVNKTARQLLSEVVIPWENEDLIPILLPSILDLKKKTDWRYITKFLYKPIIEALNLAAAKSDLPRVTNVDTFATYYNISYGGPFNALLNPFYRDLHYACFDFYPSSQNLYPQCIKNMGRRGVSNGTVKEFIKGESVDTSKYAGFTNLKASVSGWAGLPGKIYVLVNGLNSSGFLDTDCCVGTITRDGKFALTLGDKVRVVTSISNIELPSQMANGDVIIEGIQPLGRKNPPV